MQLSIAIVFSQQKHELLAGEVFALESRFRAVKVFDRVALLKFPFERFEYLANDPPVLITADASGNLSLLNPNVRDDGDGFVIVA